MKASTLGKLISAAVLGLLCGGYVHLDHLHRGQLGREEFLVQQGRRFDLHFAKADPVGIELFTGVIMVGAFSGVYELVAFGVSKALKRGDDCGKGA